MSKSPVITIDGPSGAGKGTIARRLADQLGYHLLDSGGSVFMSILHMMRQGVLGDLIHAECGYVHDLRKEAITGGDEER